MSLALRFRYPKRVSTNFSASLVLSSATSLKSYSTSLCNYSIVYYYPIFQFNKLLKSIYVCNQRDFCTFVEITSFYESSVIQFEEIRLCEQFCEVRKLKFRQKNEEENERKTRKLKTKKRKSPQLLLAHDASDQGKARGEQQQRVALPLLHSFAEKSKGFEKTKTNSLEDSCAAPLKRAERGIVRVDWRN